MSDAYQTRKPYRARRAPQRAHYDRATVHGILDAAPVAHIGYVGADGDAAVPQVIPIFFARRGEDVLFHASSKSGLARAAELGLPMCATVSLIDAIVYSRTGFHHSMRYRSVAVHGTALLLPDGEKAEALDFMIDRLQAGRAKLLRPMNEQELKATHVVRLPIEQAVAKVSTGDAPAEEPEDLDWPVWAGIIRVSSSFGAPLQHEPSLSEAGRPDLTGPLFRG